MSRIVLLVFICLIFFQVYAIVLHQETCYTLKNNENRSVAENNALANIKNRLMEDAINVILAKRNDDTAELTDDERNAIVQSIKEMKIVEQKWVGEQLFIIVETNLDLEALNHKQKPDEVVEEDPNAVLERIRKYRENAEKTKKELAVMEEKRQQIDPEKLQLAYDNFRQGRIAQTLKQYETSIYYFEKTLEYDSEHPYADFYIGIAQAILCDHLKAIKSYKKALKHDLDKEKVYFNLGISYDAINNQDKAIDSYMEAIKLNPNSLQAYYNLGSSYLLKKDYKKAIATYQKLLEFNPDFTEVYFNLGYIYDEQKEYEKAIESYQKAISLYPEYTGAYVSLGFAYYKNKQYNEAIVALEKALSLDNQDAETHVKLGNVYEAMEAEEKTIEAYQNAAQLGNKTAQRYLEKKDISW
jgi:tetratricopeptide (TPR) repeat protein